MRINFTRLLGATLFTLFIVVQGPAFGSTPTHETPLKLETTSRPSVKLSIEGLDMIFGYIGGSAEFAVSQNITVGPYISYYSLSSSNETQRSNYTTLSLGAISTIALGHSNFSSGWITQPFIFRTTRNASGASFFDTLAWGANFGYTWFWESGVNLTTGLGFKVGRYSGSLWGDSMRVTMILPSATLQLSYSF